MFFRYYVHTRLICDNSVSPTAVFGSIARGEAGPNSDIDLLLDLNPDSPIGLFEYARLKLYLNDLLDGCADVVNRRTIKPCFATQRPRNKDSQSTMQHRAKSSTRFVFSGTRALASVR